MSNEQGLTGDKGKFTSNALAQVNETDAGISSVAARYLPRILLEALCRCLDPQSAWIEPVEGSLLFADISGFTRMSEQLAELGKEGAERLTDIVNDFFSRMLDIGGLFGGDNIKFGGDALLLLFTGENHASRAIAAALGMVRATKRFKVVRIGKDRFHLNMSAGVHSGKFWSAAAGLPDVRMQHFLLGWDVSRVAVAESHAQAGEVIISPATRQMMRDKHILEEKGEFFRVLGLADHSRHTAIRPTETSPCPVPPNVFTYLPPPVVHSLGSGDKTRAIEGEHRKVTVQFINVLGVNELSESEGPDALLAQLQQYLSTVVGLTAKHEGFLVGSDIDVQGLKLILTFGAPVAHEYDSANALRLALKLDAELSPLDLRLRHRMGVHTGFVFSGEVGSLHRRDYTVMGDAVNISARLMGKAEPGQILLSGRLAEEVGPAFKVRRLAPLTMKGKKKPIPACQLEGEERDIPEHTAQSNTLFGRERELDILKQVCHETEADNTRCVVIVGDAGIGKSALVAKLKECVTERGWTVYQGHCYSHTSSSPFVPWVSILSSLFGIGPTDEVEARTQKVLASLRELAPNLLPFAPLLNALLGLSIAQSDVVQSLDDEARRRRLLDIVTEVLKASATTNRSAVIVENLQWADHSSLQMISHIGRSLKSCTFLLCLTYRHKPGVELELPDDTTVTIRLGELPEDAALALTLSLLNKPEVPERVTNAILSKAQGNPLYLEQVVRSLRQSGALEYLVQIPAFRLAQEVAELDVPDQLHSLIMSRIDSLDGATRDLLRVATVIGTTFDVRILSSVLDSDPGEALLMGRLQELERLDFIQKLEGVEQPSFRFEHSIIQESAYSSLLFARRRELHRRVAVHIENEHMGRLDSVYEVLMHHYSQCRDNAKIRFYGLRTAHKARQVFACEEAIDYYQRCLNTLSDKSLQELAARSYFLELIGDCRELLGSHVDGASTFITARRQWRRASRRGTVPPRIAIDRDYQLQTKNREAVLCHKIAVAYERNCEYDLSLKWLQLALRVLPLRQPEVAARITVTRSLALYRKGLLDEAIRWGRIGLSLSRRSRDKQNLAYAYNILANSYVDVSQIRKGILYRRLAIKLYEETGNLLGQAHANNNLGVAFQSLGDQKQALHYFRVALTLYERIGDFVSIAIAHNNVGEVLVVMGRLDEAIDHLLKVVETYEQKGEPVGCSGLAMVNLSRAYQRKGDYEKAFESLRRGVQLLRKVRVRAFVAEGVLQEAELELETGHTQTAFRLCQCALKEVTELGMKIVESRGLRIMGRIRSALADYSRAEADLLESITLAKNAGGLHEEGLSLLSVAELYLRQPEVQSTRPNALKALRKAASILASLGAQRDLARAVQLLAILES